MQLLRRKEASLNWGMLFLVLMVVARLRVDTLQSIETRKAGEITENSIGMRLAFVPAGSFVMGSEPNEKGRQDEEVQHPVKISRPFLIAITEVTQKQWTALMGANPSQHKGDFFPVEKVSWNGAIAFCKKLSDREGRIYRLPTEAEWEYACRAGATGAFGGVGQIDKMGWFEGNSGNQSHPVTGKEPNSWGLFDMHGNVAEWCSDYYSPEYPDGEVVDPMGPKEGKARVVRGGSYAYFAAASRCAARSSLPESYQVPHTGLRVVMEVTP